MAKFTHESGLEKVFGHEDLIGGIGGAVVDPALLDLDHAVAARREQHCDSRRHRLHHDRSTAALHPIQRHDHKLPQRRLERHQDYHCHLQKNHHEQKLNHPLSTQKEERQELGRILSLRNGNCVRLQSFVVGWGVEIRRRTGGSFGAQERIDGSIMEVTEEGEGDF